MSKPKDPPKPPPPPDDCPAHVLCQACDGAGAGYEGGCCDKCGAILPDRRARR